MVKLGQNVRRVTDKKHKKYFSVKKLVAACTGIRKTLHQKLEK